MHVVEHTGADRLENLRGCLLQSTLPVRSLDGGDAPGVVVIDDVRLDHILDDDSAKRGDPRGHDLAQGGVPQRHRDALATGEWPHLGDEGTGEESWREEIGCLAVGDVTGNSDERVDAHDGIESERERVCDPVAANETICGAADIRDRRRDHGSGRRDIDAYLPCGRTSDGSGAHTFENPLKPWNIPLGRLLRLS